MLASGLSLYVPVSCSPGVGCGAGGVVWLRNLDSAPVAEDRWLLQVPFLTS